MENKTQAQRRIAERFRALRKQGRTIRDHVPILAAVAIISVGFGGAVGPEAGILAIVAELSKDLTNLPTTKLGDHFDGIIAA